jgi:tetratricopeptide (TPR) repeat protein
MRQALRDESIAPPERLAALRQEGFEHLQEAVRLEPAYADARLNLGVALAERKDYEGAIVQFSEVVRLRPNDADAGRFLELARARLRETQGR